MSTMKATNVDKPGLEGWVELLADIRFPILEQTAKNVRGIKTSAGMSMDRFCDSMLHDPGTVLTMLRWANSLPRGRLSSDVTTLESAAMMIGLDKVKRLPADMDMLAIPAKDEHMRAYMHVASRAFHAAFQAYDWAIRRADMVPKESFVAAFLHNIGEMAILLNGGEEINRIRAVIEKDGISADEAQYLVLGFSLKQLSLALAEHWKLPELVTDSLSADKATNPRVYGVMLACQLARRAENGWYTKEMLECIEHLSTFLEIDFSQAVRMAHLNAVAAARESAWYEVIHAASLLPLVPEFELDSEGNPKLVEEEVKHFCLLPQLEVYEDLSNNIRAAATILDLSTLMTLVTRAMHDGLGLNRVVFCMLEGIDHDQLNARYLLGTDSDPDFNQFQISLTPTNLFTHIMKKPQSIFLNEQNKNKYWNIVPEKLKKIIGIESFFAGSVFVDGKPIGMFYVDRRNDDCQLDEAAYKRFKILIQLTGKAIEVQRENT